MNRNRKRVAAAYLRGAGATARTGLKRQGAACKECASRKKLKLSTVYTDGAGESAGREREGLAAMLEAAGRGEFSVLVVEKVDRVSRDLTELSRILGHLRRSGVEVLEAGGRSVMFDWLQFSLMSRSHRDAMRRRIRLGQEANARRGLSTGVRCYGYAAIPGRPGESVVVPEQAEVVRRAFAMRLQGATKAEIAAALNRMPGADRRWGGVSVGRLLRNPVYVGDIVYGRTRIVRDATTGKARRAAIPREEWTVGAAGTLRIVPRETWDAVQETLAGP